jgi:hypothetical protein
MMVRYSKIMKKFRMGSNFFLHLCLILFLLSTLSISCSNVNEFSLGSDFVESQTNLILTDTFAVDLSTVILDSLSTSATGVALVGDYKDDECGKITCSGYFEVGLPTYSTISENAVYDSCAFTLSYSKYFFGDTTALMSVSLHQLTENITLNSNGYLNNVSKFEYSKDPMVTKLFYPNPTSSDSILRFPANEFGDNLFTLFRNKDINISNSELFLDYIKGFVLTSGNENNKAVLGFNADSANTYFTIYYHVTEATTVNHIIKVKLSGETRQFNNIQHDFAKSSLAAIDSSANHRLLSSKSGNRSFMQAGIGLFPKIQFPTLQDIFLKNRWKILRASLVVVPVKDSYEYVSLPEDLYLYDTDKHNDNNGYVKDQSGNEIKGTFVLDKLYNENTSYTFDITNFITTELADYYFDYNHGILLGIVQNKLFSTIDRLEIEGKTPRVKLKLYYVTY